MAKYEKKDRTGLVITLLIIVIVLLLGIILYSYLVKPKFNDFVVEKQNEGIIAGQNYVVNQMLVQLQQNGYVEIAVGANQSVILVPYQPQQTAQGGVQ